MGKPPLWSSADKTCTRCAAPIHSGTTYFRGYRDSAKAVLCQSCVSWCTQSSLSDLRWKARRYDGGWLKMMVAWNTDRHDAEEKASKAAEKGHARRLNEMSKAEAKAVPHMWNSWADRQ